MFERFILAKRFGIDCEIGTGGLLKCGVLSSELLHLSGFNLGIETFRVTLSAGFKRGFHIDLEQILISNAFASKSAQLIVRGDKGCHRHDATVGKKLGHFRDTADIFEAVFVGETEIAVEPVAHVVAVESIAGDTLFDEQTLERRRDSALTGARKPGEPERTALKPK